MPHVSAPFLRRAAAVAFALVLGLGAAGCDHLTDPAGPRLIDRFGPFTLLEPLAATQGTVDFAAGETVVFTASFSKQVNWVVEITGRQSGAVKRIEGFSAELNGQNARWNGSTTELPFFKEEVVDAVLLVPDETAETTATEVEVVSPRTYPGTVAAEFEGADNLTVGNFEFELTNTTGVSDLVPPAQGDGFFLFRGTDNVVTNFFVGLVDIRPQTGSFFAVPTTAPEDLYFNFFLYSFDSPNTIAVVQLIADANGTGDFEDGQDTVFAYGDINVSGEGWQAFAKPLSEIGISAEQAGQLVAIRVLLISNENSQPDPPLQVDFGIDYLTFTSGGPLQI